MGTLCALAVPGLLSGSVYTAAPLPELDARLGFVVCITSLQTFLCFFRLCFPTLTLTVFDTSEKNMAVLGPVSGLLLSLADGLYWKRYPNPSSAQQCCL